MDTNFALQKIKELMSERKWSIYRLSKESDIPYSSLNSMFNKNNYPTIPTLEKICAAFRITLSEFFSDHITPFNAADFLTKEERMLIEIFRVSDSKNKEVIKTIVKALK